MQENTQYPQGRELFISKCNSCHALYSPNDYTESTWDSILVTMKEKAKLNNEQSNEIYKWIMEVKMNNKNAIIEKK